MSKGGWFQYFLSVLQCPEAGISDKARRPSIIGAAAVSRAHAHKRVIALPYDKDD